MFSTVLIYLAIFLWIARRSRQDPTFAVPRGARPLMLMYPAIYVVCTIPLAAGRIATLAGQQPPLAYFCVAGAMIASNGWLDALLYSITRADLIFSESPPGDATGLETFGIYGLHGRTGGLGTTTVIESGKGEGRLSRLRNRGRQSDSEENLYGMGAGMGINGIEVKGEVVVKSRDADETELRQLHRLRNGRQPSLSDAASTKSMEIAKEYQSSH